MREDLIRLEPKYPNQELNLIVPMAVSVNHLYMFKNGKRFMTKKGDQYMKDVFAITEHAVKKQKYKVEEHGVWLVVEMTFYFPDKRRRDCSNMHKLVLDSLECVAFKDDRWVLVEDKFVGLDKENPRIEIKIRPQNYKEAMRYVERANI